jgi:hypothetical protein
MKSKRSMKARSKARINRKEYSNRSVSAERTKAFMEYQAKYNADWYEHYAKKRDKWINMTIHTMNSASQNVRGIPLVQSIPHADPAKIQFNLKLSHCLTDNT